MAYAQGRPPPPPPSSSSPKMLSTPPSMATSSARPLQLDQWANTKAPLSSTQRASVNRLAEWLHRNSSDFKQQQQRQTHNQSANDEAAAPSGSNNKQGPVSSKVDEAESKDRSFPAFATNDAAISLPDATAPLVSAQGFLAWYTQLSDSVTSSTQTSHRQALQRISEATSTADNLLSQLEACQVNVSELRAGTAFVQDSSRGIREQAQALLDSQTHLDTLAEDIASRLSFFTLLPYATNMLSSPDSSIVYSQSFLELMDQLDMALLFLQQEPARSYRDAALYRMRYSQCVTRAATLAKMAVVKDIKAEAERTADRVKQLDVDHKSSDANAPAPASTPNTDSKGKARALSDDVLAEASPLGQTISDVLFVDAAQQVTKLRPLIFELQKRASNFAAGPSSTSSTSTAAEFESLLQECRTAWYQYRRPVLSRVLLQKITDIEARTSTNANEAQSPVIQHARSGAELLRHVLQNEYQLYQKFFGADGAADRNAILDAGLSVYFAELAETVMAKLRPRLAKQEDVRLLAQMSAAVAEAVRSDIKGEEAWSQGILPFLNETQSRLLARAQAIISTDIAQFTPNEEDGDLDFPERITAYRSSSALTSAAGAAGLGRHRRAKSGAGLLDAALSASHAASSSTAQQEKVELFTLPAALASTYYTPVEYMLELLFHLQATVSATAFRKIAIASVDACMVSVGKGAQALVKRKKGSVQLDREDGWLFELRQLEILREAVVSAELVLKQAGEERSAMGLKDGKMASQTNSSAGSLVDLSSLVNAINSLWANTGRLLYPSSAATDTEMVSERQEQQLDMQSSSSAVAAKLQDTIDRIAAAWSDAIVLPLRVFIDQQQRDVGKYVSTQQAFETCIESVVEEKAGKVGLWVEDTEVQRRIVENVADKVRGVYGKYLEAKPEGVDEAVMGVKEVGERLQGEWAKVLSL